MLELDLTCVFPLSGKHGLHGRRVVRKMQPSERNDMTTRIPGMPNRWDQTGFLGWGR
jgi:hypothetical protein